MLNWDETLVDKMKAGDQRSFEQCYRQLSPTIYTAIIKICRDEGNANDLLQDTFIKAFDKIESYTFQHLSFVAWLKRIAFNNTFNFLKKQKLTLVGIDDLDDYELVVSKFGKEDDGEGLITIACTGFASKINYITDHGLQITDKKSGIEVAIEIASKHFKVDSNITKSKDKMNWCQHSITDKAFINNCLMHSNLGKSFVACAITADGEFIIRDIVKYIKSLNGKYDWKFTTEAEDDDNVIVIDGNPEVSSDSGFINNWLGYKRII